MTELERIENLQDKISKALAEGERALGRKQEILNTLSSKYGIKDIKEIPQYIETMEKDKKELENKMNSMLSRLEERYGWKHEGY